MASEEKKLTFIDRLKLYGARFFFLLISTLCVCIFLEGFLRYKLKVWPFEGPSIRFSYLTLKDKDLKWRFPPNNWTDHLGLRNRGLKKKKKNHLRVLFLGDSLVRLGETSSGLLNTKAIEKKLNQRIGHTRKKIVTINAGISGYTTYQELEFLKIYGLPMEPDFVILGFVFNDVYYKYLHKPSVSGELEIEPEALLQRFDPRPFPNFLFSRSYFAHKLYFTFEKLTQKIVGKSTPPFEYRVDFYLAWKNYGWGHTKKLMGEMKTLLVEKELPFMIVIFPMKDQMNEALLRADRNYVLFPQKKIKQICHDHHIPYLDLTDCLIRRGGSRLFKDHLHLKPEGNDIVVHEVTKYLIRQFPRFLARIPRERPPQMIKEEERVIKLKDPMVQKKSEKEKK